MTDYSSWKVADLKVELKKRGIPQTGLRLKQQFIDKLVEEDTKAQPTQTAGTELGNTAQQENAPEPAPLAQEPQTEQPQPEQQPSEPRQPEAPQAQEQLQIEPTPERIDAQPDVKQAQPPAGTDTKPTEDVAMPEAGPDEVTEATTKPIEQAAENLDTEKPTDASVLQTPEANTELSTPLPVEEALEDKRKRKRRSKSPVPTAEAIANKKVRAQEEIPRVTSKEDQKEDTKDTTQELPVPAAAEESPSGSKQNAQLRGLLASTEAAAAQASSDAQDITMEDAIVEPALHPATASLYIDGMMRPMNGPLLRTHLVELATASSTAPDRQLISEFYLDTIKTHCFVQFSTAAAAARVRSRIHGAVWPVERNRKKLWADFIPDEQIKKFIETEEEASRNRRGRPVRWEVKYEQINDTMKAFLVEESDSHSKPEPAQTNVEFNRTPPSGPRGSAPQAEHRPSNAPPAPPSRPGQGFKPLDELFESTTTKPKLYYLPVPRKVADKRLDQFDELLRKGTFARRGGDDMRRITFEDDDDFVDAGPEYGARALQRRQARGGRGGDSRRGR